MRMMMQVILPLEPFNAKVRDGSIEATMMKLLEASRPEAAYFTETDGQRSAYLIVDVPNPWDVPRLAEPWFLTMHAEVKFRICMTPEELGRSGLKALGSAWG